MTLNFFPEPLQRGYQNFLQGRFLNERNRYKALAEQGQQPEIMVIGCCDSRVSPEVIFDAGPGELFVVRNVANLVPLYQPDSETYHGTSAAIEFAVNALKVKHIVVLGHASCGGISSFFKQTKPLESGDFIGKWMSQILPTMKRLGLDQSNPSEDLKRLEWAVVEQSMSNLMTFPYIQHLVASGNLQIHGTYFGVATGLLFIREPTTGVFCPFDSYF